MLKLPGSLHHGWLEALRVYSNPRVLVMLFLGFSAGVPLLLIFSSLSLWLRDAGVQRADVTYLSWAALGYSFKFIWAPLIDKLPLPILHQLLGRRRSWLLLAQLGVIGAILSMAMIDPAHNLSGMAVAAVLLGFSAASQDIVIDAYRIEAAQADVQAAMAATYTVGYRLGMVSAGAGALFLSGWLSGGGEYNYAAWRQTYMIMSCLVGVGILTTLLIREPEANRRQSQYLHSATDYLRFLLLFLCVTASFIAVFSYSAGLINELKRLLSETLLFNGLLSGFIAEVIRLLLSLSLALLSAWVLMLMGAVNRNMTQETYVEPVVDFFRRYGKAALLILLLVGFYRVSDIVLGTIAYVFYNDIGFSNQQIGFMSGIFGVIMTIVGGLLGGFLAMRFGVLKILLLGAVLSAVTNLLFVVLANSGSSLFMLGAVITIDNLSAGLAMAAFIAYLSSLTNISFTAMQYAIFSSLMTLFPKLLGGYSGSIVDAVGYPTFFIGTAILGVPIILLIVYLMQRQQLASQ